MNRHLLRFALAAALFGAAIPAAASAADVSLAINVAQNKWWTPEPQAAQFNRFHRDMFEGRWVVQDRDDADFRGGWGNGYGRGGRFGAVLPNFLSIDQNRRMLTVSGPGRNVIQLITTDNGYHTMRGGATLLHGTIFGNRIVASGRDSRGRLVQQTMILRNRGNVLIVKTQVERGNSGRMVEVEKVYERA